MSTHGVIPEEKRAQIERISLEVFGKTPSRVAFPGGASRDAFVADIDGQLCVFAQRKVEASAVIEGQVLMALSRSGHTPKYIGRHGRWLIQECVPGIRLPILIDQASSMQERADLLSRSLEALLKIKATAHTENLHERLQKIDSSPGWRSGKVSKGDKISENLGLKIPEFDRDAVAEVLNIEHNEFVKHDARPGNALVFEGRPYWFDFEDCGAKRAIDDLIYVLCDEWTAIDEKTEAELIDRFLPRFSSSPVTEETWAYFHVFGVMHMMSRLSLIVKYQQRKNEWWDREMCLSQDKVGITREEAGRLCWRAKNWCRKEQLFSDLLKWFDTVVEKLDLEDSANL